MSLEFTEYTYAKPVYGAQPQLPPGQETATQSIAIGAASVQSSAFDARTALIVITKVDTDCRIKVGEDPTAVTTGANQTRLLKAGSEYSFAVEPGHKLAVVQA